MKKTVTLLASLLIALTAGGRLSTPMPCFRLISWATF